MHKLLLVFALLFFPAVSHSQDMWKFKSEFDDYYENASSCLDAVEDGRILYHSGKGSAGLQIIVSIHGNNIYRVVFDDKGATSRIGSCLAVIRELLPSCSNEVPTNRDSRKPIGPRL